jgi:NADP-dependent 3-hydroxy acid dehydrogenase YdfG
VTGTASDISLAAANAAYDRFRRLDIVINNAGPMTFKRANAAMSCRPES